MKYKKKKQMEISGRQERTDSRKDEMIKEKERTVGMTETSWANIPLCLHFFTFFHSQLYSQCLHPNR